MHLYQLLLLKHLVSYLRYYSKSCELFGKLHEIDNENILIFYYYHVHSFILFCRAPKKKNLVELFGKKMHKRDQEHIVILSSPPSFIHVTRDLILQKKKLLLGIFSKNVF